MSPEKYIKDIGVSTKKKHRKTKKKHKGQALPSSDDEPLTVHVVNTAVGEMPEVIWALKLRRVSRK